MYSCYSNTNGGFYRYLGIIFDLINIDVVLDQTPQSITAYS